MRLHQLKVEYVAAEDRLLVRISTSSNEEVMLWLTRRAALRLWPVLLSMAQAKPEIVTQPSPEARRALVGFEHEKAVAKADFSKPYEQQPERARPLGEAPILVGRIEPRRDPEGRPVLGLLPAQGQGIFITLDDRLLHGFMRLLQNAVARAEWGFKLAVPGAEAVAADAAPKTIN
ncbi:MAG: hypothetical protein N2544_05895 [Burkholderiales bacterium]|nr:hypothetical protein [Burkholderiales bacterium]